MDKFVKVQSLEGSEITATDNIRHFTVSAGDVYDLRDSFLQFSCEIERTETSAGGGSGVYNNMVQWVTADAEKPHFQNVAFVKNAHLKSQMKGNIESLRRVDILKQNLSTVAKSQRTEADQSYVDINQLPFPINNQQYSLFGSFNKTGAVKSIESTTVPLQVRLSDVFDFCATDEYDTNRGGELNMRLELNRDKLEAVQIGKDAQAVPAGMKSFKDIGATEGVGNTIVVGAGTTQTRVFDLKQSLYYVGQKLLISATAGGTALPDPVANEPVVISSILWDKGNADQSLGGKLSITFETNWGSALTGDQTYTGITATIAECTPTLKINQAELVLKKKPEGERENYDSINFTTFSTEEGNGGARTQFQDLFTVEGDATQAFMTFAQGSDDLISSCPLVDFRCSLNNIDVTDRDVVVKEPLYYDRLAGSLDGMGYKLKNLVLNAGVSNEYTYTDVYKKANADTKPLVAELFQTPQSKFLQVKANAGTGGVNNYQLFKAIPKVFTY